MKHGYCTTREERRNHWSQLSMKFEQWRKMQDHELLNEVKEKFPITTEGTRDEFIKFLVMDHVEKMI